MVVSICRSILDSAGRLRVLLAMVVASGVQNIEEEEQEQVVQNVQEEEKVEDIENEKSVKTPRMVLKERCC